MGGGIRVENNAFKVETDITKKLQLPDLVHGIKVAELSVKLAEYCNLNIDYKKLYISGALHDIGKAYLHENILNNPGRLTNKEYLHIKNHCRYGAQVCLAIGFDYDIVKSVLYHHENFDGSGYPKGLKGNEIPIIARILRICDVYCALTTKRAYRNGKTNIEAIEIMEREKRFYDPDLYNVFLEMINKDQLVKVNRKN